MRNKIATLVFLLFLTVCCWECAYNANPDRMVKQEIQRQLKGVSYRAEKTELDPKIYLDDGNGEIEFQWDIYVPKYDVTYHIWYESYDAIISDGERLHTDFSGIFLTHFLERYQGDFSAWTFGKRSELPDWINSEYTFMTSYNDEETLGKSITQMKDFCSFVSEECDFAFETQFTFTRNCEIKAVEGPLFVDSRVLIVSPVVGQETELTMASYYERVKNQIERADIRVIVRLYPDPEVFYSHKTQEEILDAYYDNGYLTDSEHKIYDGIHADWAGLTGIEVYKLLETLQIPATGTPDSFSFTSNGRDYKFSYAFYDKNGCYYLENGTKKTLQNGYGFLYSYELLEEALGVKLRFDMN